MKSPLGEALWIEGSERSTTDLLHAHPSRSQGRGASPGKQEHTAMQILKSHFSSCYAVLLKSNVWYTQHSQCNGVDWRWAGITFYDKLCSVTTAFTGAPQHVTLGFAQDISARVVGQLPDDKMWWKKICTRQNGFYIYQTLHCDKSWKKSPICKGRCRNYNYSYFWEIKISLISFSW